VSAKAAEEGGGTVHPNYRWISSVRAAEWLGVSIRDLYRLIDRADLPAYRIAGEIRLLAHEVEAFHEKFPNPRELL
jgi:excisionase family DNA binding protein